MRAQEGNGSGSDLTVDGMAVYLAVPETTPAPGVLVLHELFGLNDDIRAIADRFAALGYVAAAPDLVGGGSIRCVARALRDLSRSDGPTVAAAERMLEWLSHRPDVHGGVGVAGFCMGASFAMLLGSRGDAAVVSAAYGEPPDDDLVARMCPTVAHYGDLDRMFRRFAEPLDAGLARAGIPHDVKRYPGVGHSFMNRGDEDHPVVRRIARPLMAVGYDEDAAEDAWRRIEAFFAVYLTRAEPEIVIDLRDGAEEPIADPVELNDHDGPV